MASNTLPRRELINTGERHGRSRTPEYQAWANMMRRCYDPSSEKYHLYGGRGIEVCERWRKSFLAFYEDMGPRPKGGTLERDHVDRNYEPNNCRWAAHPEQSRNTRSNRWIEYNGRRMILEDWATELGVTHSALIRRLDSDKCTVGQALGFDPPPERGWRNVRLITYDGKSLPIAEWARFRGIERSALSIRLSNPFWTIAQALGYEPPPPRGGDSNSSSAVRQRRHREKLKQERERLQGAK